MIDEEERKRRAAAYGMQYAPTVPEPRGQLPGAAVQGLPPGVEEEAAKTYGRSWAQLTPQEQKAIFSSYKGKRAMYSKMASTGPAKGKNVGADGRIHVGPTWSESLSAGLKSGIGMRGLIKANKQEALGRKAAADLAANRDQSDTSTAATAAVKKKDEDEDFLSRILGLYR